MTELAISKLIDELRRIGKDTDALEAKECVKDLSKDIWETVSAFANTEGGTIILGLSERSGFTPAPGFDPAKTESRFISGMSEGGTGARISNAPQYSTKTVEFEGSILLAIMIEELDPARKPCFIKDRGKSAGSFKRIGDADIPLTANEVYSLENAVRKNDADRASVEGAAIADLDESISMLIFAKAQQITPRALKDADDYATRLKRLNLLDGNENVTKAGLMVAGCYPQQFFPKLHIDVASHPGKEKSSAEGVRFLDRAICEGTIGEMMEESMLAIARNLRKTSTVTGAGRVDELEIPEEVLREALANALIHRDYDPRFDGEAVSVDIFEDRIEITNPGGLWGGKSKSNLKDGRSCCRNATLMKLLSISPLPSSAGSPAEGNGSGILLMCNEMKKRGLGEPAFCPAIDHFKVILRRQGTEPIREKHVNQAAQDAIYEFLIGNGEKTAREIAEGCGLTLNQVRNRLRKLIEAEKVEATAPLTSKSRKYRAND